MMPESYSLISVNDSTLSLSGKISHKSANDAINSLTKKIKVFENKELIIDLEHLKSVNSAVLSVLLSGLRAAKKYACQLQYINIPTGLFNMARVGGVETLLTNAEL